MRERPSFLLEDESKLHSANGFQTECYSAGSLKPEFQIHYLTPGARNEEYRHHTAIPEPEACRAHCNTNSLSLSHSRFCLESAVVSRRVR